MGYKLVILGRLPCLNDYIKALGINRHKGGKLKKETQESIMWLIVNQVKGMEIKNPVIMAYSWYEKDKRRDKSNVSSFGRKCIEDCLVTLGVLHNDGWANVEGFSDTFYVDAKNPRIEIDIIELEG